MRTFAGIFHETSIAKLFSDWASTAEPATMPYAFLNKMKKYGSTSDFEAQIKTCLATGERMPFFCFRWLGQWGESAVGLDRLGACAIVAGASDDGTTYTSGRCT